MAINMNTAISFLEAQVGHTTYSMYGSRNFSDGTCDCSGAVYTALRKAGASNLGYIASTETLHAWLKANGFKCIAENRSWSMQRGDVVIWGRIGQSAGAGGHTGICVDGQNWLECTAYKNLGETLQNHDARHAMNGQPYFYVYRLQGGITNPPKNKPSTPEPSQASQAIPTVDVTYALHTLAGSWLPDVTNLQDYAGTPGARHDLLTIRVNRGSVKYRAHSLGRGWSGYVTGSNKRDTINGCAGIPGVTIDAVEVQYITPQGEPYQQAWYRSQTVSRSGWLNIVCDDGKSVKGYRDTYAGIVGEPLDRLEIDIRESDPFR